MSLEQAFRRLAVRPSSICRQCQRSFATAIPRQQPSQQRSATQSFTDLLQSSRTQAAQPQRDANLRRPASTTTATPSAPAPTTTNPSAYDIAARTIRESAAPAQQAARDAALADVERSYNRKDLEQQQSRRWREGDVYAPHDLTGVEAAKWKRIRSRPAPTRAGGDVMDRLGLNPMTLYRNFSVMSEYVTEMGRIKHRSLTALRPVNQRRMAKAVRRAIGMGLMPSVHRHPEILRQEWYARGRG